MRSLSHLLMVAVLLSLSFPFHASPSRRSEEPIIDGGGEDGSAVHRPRRSLAPRGICRNGGSLEMGLPNGFDAIADAGFLHVLVAATPPSPSDPPLREGGVDGEEAGGGGYRVVGTVEKAGGGGAAGFSVALQGSIQGSAAGGLPSLEGKIEVDASVPGTFLLTAELVGERGKASGCVAHVRFESQAGGGDTTLESVMEECQGRRAASIKAWASSCARAIQLGHEKGMAGDARGAAGLLAGAVAASAARESARDVEAHHLLVYPYLEMARIGHAGGDRDLAGRAMQLVRRLQPGYTLPDPVTKGREGYTLPDPLPSSPSPSPSQLAVDLDMVSGVDLGGVLHLVCEWTAYELQGQGGMSMRSAVASPGGHYKLLSYLASLLSGALIVEMGTMHGASALALALGNASNRVITYNILDDFTPNAKACGMSADEFEQNVKDVGCNIEFRIEDVLSSPERMEEMLGADLIHIDINHHGDIEDAVLQYLAGMEYKGLVMLDDIYLNRAMDTLWGSIGSGEGWKPCKYDLTDWGHTMAGTGLVDFSCKVRFVGI